tara:strand:+ start:32850 stop:33434 length:585 start_codon:yes stop_codon:yes gene_type:complete
MNVGIVTTFLVGGIFLISILSFNQQVLLTTQELTLNSINQNNINDIVTVMTNDFNRIGFNTGSSDPFSRIDDDDIIFQSDAHDTDNFGVTNVRWYLDTSDPVTTTSNPNDYYLKRVGPTSANSYGTIKFPATFFQLKYYTGNGTETSNPEFVRQVEVQLIVETGEPYSVSSSVKEYPKSVWKRIFVPNNINLPF